MSTYFPVVANYAGWPQGSTVNGPALFTPNLVIGGSAIVTAETPPLDIISETTQGYVANGTLQMSPTVASPVYLRAQTSDLNLTGTLQYTASFQLQIGTQPVPVPGFIFDAQTPRTVTDAAMTNTSTTLTSATAAFTSNDVGAVVTVAGAIPDATSSGTVTTIVSVTNSTTVVLSQEATATVSGAAASICQALNLIEVTPAAANSVSGILEVTTSGISDATAFAQAFLRDADNQADAKTYLGVTAGGDASTNTSSSVDSTVAVFSGTAGKTLKEATGSGLAKLTSGVLGTATAGTDYVAPSGSGAALTGITAAQVGAAPAETTTYYVANSGSDSNNGLTTSTPFATVGKATSVAQAGTTILLQRGGSWDEEIDLQKDGLKLGAYGAGAAPINDRASGTNTVGIWIDGAHDVTVEDLEIRNVGLATIEIQDSYRATVQRCHLHGSLGHGILIAGVGGYHTIQNNEIDHTGSSATLGTGNGIQLLDTIFGVNIVANNYFHNIGFNYGDHGIYSEGGVNQFLNNRFDTVVGNGIKVMDGSAGTLVARNRISNTQTGGIFIDYAVATGVATLIYQNTLYNCGPASGGFSPNTGIWLQDHSNVVARNNIIHTSGNGLQVDTNSTLDSDYNVFFNISSEFGYTRPGGTWTPYATLSAWQTATGNDEHSIVADPLLIDPTNLDFNLGLGSPATDVGLLIQGINDNYLGAGPDIGWNESANLDLSDYVTVDGTQTLTNKTFDSPQFDSIRGTNDHQVLFFDDTGNGNYVEIDSANNGSAPTLYFWGTSDTNVNGSITMKGTGTLTINNAVDIAGAPAVTTTATQTLTNKTLTSPTITNSTESVVAIGSTGTSKTIALTNGAFQTATLTGNCTFTMPSAVAGKSFKLLLNTGAGSFTATFTGVKWPAGTAPTITVTAARLDVLTFISDGTDWYGSFVQNYTP